MKKQPYWLILPALVIAFVLFQALFGGWPALAPPKDHFDVMAHRGVHVNWVKGSYDSVTGCEASHIVKPTHDYIENTIKSIGAAFDMGATIVEIDIRQTADDRLVVFHDYSLECRTEGEGLIRDHTVEYLQTLDIGYGYTADGGQTHPFRGDGVGLMPTLEEVLETYPDRRFWVDHKDGDLESADLLIAVIKGLPTDQQARITYWGPESIYDHIHAELPVVTRPIANRPLTKRCYLPYLLTFGLSGFPAECSGEGFGMPFAYRRILWGWPYRFLRTANRNDVRFYLLADTVREAAIASDLPVDGIITEYIEVIGPAIRISQSADHD
jgi:glycerophosphoryl diester phosphodiesterase